MSTQTRRILIKVDTTDSRALDDISRKMGLLNSNTKSLAGGMRFLTTAFSGWIGYLGVSQLTRMSDEIQNVSNRLKIVTGSTEGAEQALKQLAEVADRTKQSISDTGATYVRIAQSLKQTNATTSELLALTETLTNTFRVSGSTGAETAATIVQLSQAFSLGALRGQELRSVLSQNAVLAGLLKERFGQDLFKSAEKGLIKGSTVLELLAKNAALVNSQAKELAPTFEQTLTKSMNKVSLTIGELNKQFGLSAKFAVVMEVAVNSLSSVMAILSGVMVVVAGSAIPTLITQLRALWAAMLAFVSTNPVTASLAAIVTLSALVYINFDKLKRVVKGLQATFYEFQAAVQESFLKVNKFFAGDDKNGQLGVRLNQEAILSSLRKARDIRQEIANQDLAKVKQADANDPANLIKNLEEKLKAFESRGKQAQKKIKEILGELNTEFLKGEITAEQYNAKLISFNLYKVKREFQEGKMDVFKFHEEIRDLNIEDLNRKLAQGTITMDKFNASVQSEKFKVLKEQVDAGKISLQDFNEEVNKLDTKFSESSPITVGVNRYMNSIGTLADNISNGIQKTLSAMEDGIVQFVKTGKFNFKDFADTVIEEIIRIQVRMAIAGIISSIVGSFASSGSGATDYGGQGYSNPNVAYAANGGVMTSKGMMPLHTYATGGIAKSPQMAVFGEGRMPEAYVPLPNGRSIPVEMKGGGGGGDNYVTVQVNMQSGEEDTASATEKGRTLGKLISAAVQQELIKQKRPGGVLYS